MGESSSRTIAFSFVEPRTVVLVHARENPTDEEWRAYVDALRNWVDRVGERLVSLVVTEGGGPNTVQRTDLNDTLLKAHGSFATAVITDSRVVRGMVTAMSWFNSGIRAFAPKQLGDAVGYLELDDREHQAALAAVDHLRAQLDLAPLKIPA